MAIYHLSHTYVGKSTQKQAYTASAHSNYITRPTRATDVMGARMSTNWREAAAWLQAQEDADRKNGRVIDKVEIALPKELTHEQNAELVRSFCQAMTKGRAPWLAAMHDGPKDADNPHAHIIFRDRDFETGKRVMLLSELDGTETLRVTWEREANLALERAGLEVRIDRRTLEEQGIAREPQIHVGPKNQVFEEKGFTPESKPREVIRHLYGQHQSIIIDYATLDSGRSRAEFNQAIKERNAAREHAQHLPGAARDQLHELGDMNGPTSGQPFANAPATQLDHDEQRRNQQLAADAGMEWTNRAGMAAQQSSALEWAERARQRQEGRVQDLGADSAPDPSAPDPRDEKRSPDTERARFIARYVSQGRKNEQERDGGREL